MRHLRFGRTAATLSAVLAAFPLAACQTSKPPAPTPLPTTTFLEPNQDGLSDAPGRVIAQNKGWVVRLHPATKDGAAYCVATRTDPAASPLTFRATATGAAMVVNGDQHAQAEGESNRLTAIFPDGEKVAMDAHALPNGGVMVPVELPKYEDLFEPFIRSKTVTLQSDSSGKIGEFSLGGSSWAINALEECRILHTER